MLANKAEVFVNAGAKKIFITSESKYNSRPYWRYWMMVLYGSEKFMLPLSISNVSDDLKFYSVLAIFHSRDRDLVEKFATRPPIISLRNV